MRGRFDCTMRLLMGVVLLLSWFSASAETVSGNPAWSCLNRYVVTLARRAELVTAVQAYNKAPPDYAALDAQWAVLSEDAPDVSRVLTHPLVAMLEQTISSVSYHGEGMVMGRDGGLVAATGKTTDFWQGDETQFTRAIGLLPGQVHVEGDIPDESTHAMLIKISTPIIDPVTRQAIGVLMLGFDQFVVDFEETCAPNRHMESAPPVPGASP